MHPASATRVPSAGASREAPMTERPMYGEYASPEEQRRLAGLPPVDAVRDAVAEAPAAGSVPARPASAGGQVPAPHPVDRLVTFALLGFGLFNVLTTAWSYLDLPRVMTETMKILGIEGEFTNFAQGRLWGTIAAVVLVTGWVITTIIATRRLRAGKRAWWVPIAGAVATLTVVSVCVMVPMTGDPAFLAHVDSFSAS